MTSVKQTKLHYELGNYGFDKQMRQAIEQTLESLFSEAQAKEHIEKDIIFCIASCYCLLVAYPSRDDWKISLRLKPVFEDVMKIMSLSNMDESCIEKALIRYCRLLIKLNQ